MNDKLHRLLDGEPIEGNPIGSPEEMQSFAELRRLQEALRGNATHGGLSVAEKGAIGANLAAVLGINGTDGAPVAGGATSWLKSIGLMLLGAGLGAGIFFLVDGSEAATPPPVKPEGIIIEAEGTTPALFPFVLAEPSAHDLCMSKVTALRDSIQKLQETATPKKTRPRRSNRLRTPKYPKPVPGE